MKFLLQTINKRVVHDFIFELERSIEYQRWRGEKIDLIYASIEEVRMSRYRFFNEGFISIGTIEFVEASIPGPLPPPINIPPYFLNTPEITGKAVVQIRPDNKTLIQDEVEYYVKDCRRIKNKINGWYKGKNICNLNLEYIQVRERIDNILSEWRVFVYLGDIRGCQFYSGDPLVFPNSDKIKEIVKKYNRTEDAYTLDIFITPNGTFLMEVHDFYSCGLYGFSDYQKLPYMFSRTWRNLTKAKI